MLEWITDVGLIGTLIMAIGMVLGITYYLLFGKKKMSDGLFLVIVLILLAMCMPIFYAVTVSMVGSMLLIGFLCGISGIAIINKSVPNPEITLVQHLKFRQSELEKFQNDPTYGFDLEEAEFCVLCSMVLPQELKTERINMYYEKGTQNV